MPVPPRPAATVILTRPQVWTTPREILIYLVRRDKKQAFLGGYFCFPGGVEDPTDAATATRLLGDRGASLVVCAIRELFEETGVLLSPDLSAAQVARLPGLRRDLNHSSRSLEEIVSDLGATLDRDLLRPAGRWVTPAFLPQRYDTQYYLAGLPPSQEPTVVPGELEDGMWIAPEEALGQFAQGALLIPTPVRHALRAMVEGVPGVDEALARLCAAPVRFAPQEEARLYEVVPDLFMMPLASRTLPPALHTNCYIAGARDLVLIDPGTRDAEDRDVLHRALGLLQAEGRTPREVILTHHHDDHVGAAEHLRRRYGVPVAAHHLTAAALRGTLTIDRMIEDDEELVLGDHCRLRVVATPGHAPGHVALWDEARRALICGDLLSTGSFIVIDPHDGGDMAAYLASLERVRGLAPRLLLPGHGFPTMGAAERIDDYLAHRRWREERITAAVAAAPGSVTAAALLPTVYDDTPEALWPLASLSLTAHLIKLERDGALRRREDGWVVA